MSITIALRRASSACFSMRGLLPRWFSSIIPKAFAVAKAFGGEFFDKLIRRFHKETANDKRILFFLSA